MSVKETFVCDICNAPMSTANAMPLDIAGELGLEGSDIDWCQACDRRIVDTLKATVADIRRTRSPVKEV